MLRNAKNCSSKRKGLYSLGAKRKYDTIEHHLRKKRELEVILKPILPLLGNVLRQYLRQCCDSCRVIKVIIRSICFYVFCYSDKLNSTLDLVSFIIINKPLVMLLSFL